MKNIKSYIKTLNNNLIPALQNKLGANLNMQPNYTRTTKVTYSGTLDNKRLVLDFSCNHIELKDFDDNHIYCNTYYGSGGNSAGVLDLNNIDDCVEQIYAALYELGYRSEEDLEKEKQAEEERKRKEEETKQAEKERKEKERELRNLNTEEPEETIEEPTEESNENESEESIKQYSIDFDKYLKVMSDENLTNGRMEISISIDSTANNVEQYKILNIDTYYISSTMCLVQTQGINPKVDKAVTWDKAKNYAQRIAERLNGVISVVGYDPDDNELTISNDDTSSDVNVDVTL